MTDLLLGALIGAITYLLVWFPYMLFRNNAVYEYRVEILLTDYERYDQLPDYDYMVDRFWVWPLSRFEDRP